MDIKEISAEFENNLQNFHLPRSKELPDLDFYMDQVISIMEKNLFMLSGDGQNKIITPAMINNYVKLEIIPPPKKKRYSKLHICYLFIICTLKSVIPISSVTQVIKTHTENRSIFDLYDMFCEAYENMLKRAAETAEEILYETEVLEEALAKLSLFMAINAATTQLIATSTLKAFSDDSPQEDSKEKEKPKK